MVARHFLLNLTELSGATVDELAALNEYVVKETWKTLYGHDRRMYRILRAGVDRYETLTRVTGGSLSNWAQGAKPSRATVKRMAEFRMLFTALESLVYPRSINFWLRAPNPSFAGATPLQIIERGEAKRIWRLILVQELESGMPTTEQPCRIEPECVALLTRQARRRKLDVATPNSLYLKEKTLEEEYPGIGFRDSAFGREAYVQGHRVAVWEVANVYQEAKSVAKTADHLRWPPALVRCALAYAKKFAKELAEQHELEVKA